MGTYASGIWKIAEFCYYFFTIKVHVLNQEKHKHHLVTKLKTTTTANKQIVSPKSTVHEYNFSDHTF